MVSAKRSSMEPKTSHLKVIFAKRVVLMLQNFIFFIHLHVLLVTVGSRPSDDNLYFMMTPSSAASSSSSSSSGTALPVGWDASIRGMCVGERRLISLPASLAFGKQGLTLKKAGTSSKEGTIVLPPDTSIIIDVRLLSLNGVA